MAEHPYFPLFVDLSGRKVVVIGAGRVAARRVARLADFGPDIVIVAPKADSAIAEMAASGRVQWLQKPCSAEDLDGAALALIATDDAELNAQLAEQCRARGTL